MNVRGIEREDFTGKRVLVRVDFNVEIKDGDICEKYKIASAKQTLDRILSFPDVRVALISHLGRPEGKKEKSLSLEQLVDDIERVLNIRVTFVDTCWGKEVEDALEAASPGTVLLLENVRFEIEEEENNQAFAERLAKPFDIFINDAFSVCHRDQASVTGVTNFLPSFAGIQMENEIKHLEVLRSMPEHPAIAVIGGAKIETKLPMIQVLEETFDAVLLGGKVANEAIDREMTFSDKVHLPKDFISDRLDIGPETIREYESLIKRAKTIIWNGPMGKFEDPRFLSGTSQIVHAISAAPATTIAGGGESIQILEQQGLFDQFTFVSTGGGAMLSFLGREEMPGLEPLWEK